MTRLAPRVRALGQLLLPFVVFLAIWQVVAALEIWPETFLPSPLRLPETLVELIETGSLVGNVLPSVRRVVVASVVGLVLGVVLGVGVGINTRVADALTDLYKFLQAIGEIGWLPLLVLWIGFNDTTILATISYTVFFPVFFGTVSGITGVPSNLKNLVATLGGGRRQLIFEVLIPGALPSIISGFRTGMGFGWRTVILAEMLVGREGLGVMIFRAREVFRIDRILVGMIIIGIIWVAIDALVLRPLEARTVQRWGLVK